MTKKFMMKSDDVNRQSKKKNAMSTDIELFITLKVRCQKEKKEKCLICFVFRVARRVWVEATRRKREDESGKVKAEAAWRVWAEVEGVV